jgi:hypothetical protein
MYVRLHTSTFSRMPEILWTITFPSDPKMSQEAKGKKHLCACGNGRRSGVERNKIKGTTTISARVDAKDDFLSTDLPLHLHVGCSVRPGNERPVRDAVNASIFEKRACVRTVHIRATREAKSHFPSRGWARERRGMKQCTALLSWGLSERQVL